MRRALRPSSVVGRLTGIVLVVMAGLVALVSAAQIAISEHDFRAALAREESALAHRAAAELDDKIAVRVDALASVSSIFTVGDLHDETTAMEVLAERRTLSTLFDLLFVADASGKIIGTVPARSAQFGASIPDRAYFQEAMRTGRPTISAPQLGRATHAPQIIIAAPIFDASRRPVGIVAGTLLLDRPNILGNLRDARLGENGRFMLLTRDAQPLYVMHPQASKILATAPSRDTFPALYRAIGGWEGAAEGPGPSGERAMVAFENLDRVNWTLAVAYPLDETDATMRATRQRIVATTIVVLLAVSAVVFVVVLRTLKPLRTIGEELERATREHDRPAALDTRGLDEFARLARAFNALFEAREAADRELRESRTAMRMIIDNAPLQIAYTDASGVVAFCGGQRMPGLPSPETFVGRRVEDIVAPDLVPAVRARMASALAGYRERYERVSIDASGGVHYLLADYLPSMDDQGRVRGFYSFVQDVTDIKRAQTQLAENEARLRLITDNVPALISYIDRDQTYRFNNRVYETWLRRPIAELTGRRLSDVYDAQTYAWMAPQLERALRGERVEFARAFDTDTGPRYVQGAWLPHFDAQGNVLGVYGITHDVTPFKEVEAKLDRLARSDALTGLANRRAFDEALEAAIDRASTQQSGVGLLFLDVDHFKRINDTFGHGIGDVVLNEFALRLERTVGTQGRVARVAGDEFAVILEDIDDIGVAERLAHAIVVAIRAPMQIGPRRLQVTTSIGVAFDAQGHVTAKTLMRGADQALYEAKAAGRDSVQIAQARAVFRDTVERLSQQCELDTDDA